MRPDLPSGTVTFLFTDVEGSTRLLHELGAEAYAQALAEHRRVIRNACSAEGGVEVDTQGDAFFFAFPSAPGALAAAAGFTEALAPGPIEVRVGLHTGSPLLTDEGYVGDDVHFAARVAATSHGGQVVLSQAAAELVDLELMELGEHRLKDIPQAVPLYQLGEASFPPLKTISNTNLPRPASSFLGRERELEEILSRIEQGTRLLTLTGPGGTGKTRLAIESAATLVPEYKAGVFWVGLASLRDPALVTETVAQTLGAKDGLSSHIAERELLLLLDNFEQVIEAAPELSKLLQSCPNLTLLVTSRELLRVSGEVEYAVPPLAEHKAVSLFCERSQLEPSDEIAELCARLDSLPLAVELAAARTKALSPAQILERLAGRLDLLKGGRDADPRQQTLRATIEWSYDLLSEEERQLFARLSVFTGGCTLEAAEEVADANLDTMQSLVEKSLLLFSQERYWMLETIRDFAAVELTAVDAGDLTAAHARFYLRLAEEGGERLYGSAQTEWLRRMDDELDNLRAARSWFVDSGSHEEELRLVSGASPCWYMRGGAPEGMVWLEQAVEHGGGLSELRANALLHLSSLALRAGRLEVARRRAKESLDLSRTLGDTKNVIRSLTMLSAHAVEEDDFDQARRMLIDAEGLSRELDDDEMIAYTAHQLGYVAWLVGDYEFAIRLHQESLGRNEAIGDHQGAALNYENLGGSFLLSGDEANALASLREAARRFHQLNFLSEISFCLDGIAAVLSQRGAPDRAAKLLGSAEALRRELGIEMDLGDRFVNELAIERVRGLLGPDEFDRLWTAGLAIDVGKALDAAFADLD